jgi:hypothetical protein
MSGSAPAWPSSCAWRCWPPTTACMAWTWSTWRWTGAPPRRPAAARPPVQARQTGASRDSSARWSPTHAASRWGRYPPPPTAVTTGCWRPPWTRSAWSGCCPSGRWCTWMPVMTTSRAGRCWPNAAWSARSPAGRPGTDPSWPSVGGWSALTPGVTSTAGCAGAPSGAGGWWSSGWRLQRHHRLRPAAPPCLDLLPLARSPTSPPMTSYWRRPRSKRLRP